MSSRSLARTRRSESGSNKEGKKMLNDAGGFVNPRDEVRNLDLLQTRVPEKYDFPE